MATAEFVTGEDNYRIYRNSDGLLFKMILETEDELLIQDMNGVQIGEFEFQELDYGNGYKIMRMYTNEYKNTGLGSAALSYFLEIYDGPLYTSPHDGLTRDDGSHLTEDAPSFVMHMQAKGIIYGNSDRFDDDNSEHGFLDI